MINTYCKLPADVLMTNLSNDIDDDVVFTRCTTLESDEELNEKDYMSSPRE